MLLEKTSQSDGQQITADDKGSKIVHIDEMEPIEINHDIERKQKHRSIGHHVEDIGDCVDPFAESHDKLILPASFLPLVDEKGDGLLEGGAVYQPDVDSQQEVQHYFYGVEGAVLLGWVTGDAYIGRSSRPGILLAGI